MKNTFTHFAGAPLGAASYEALDRLALVEMRPYGMSQGILPHLYDTLRAGTMPPISRQIAEQVALRPRGSVTILTGMQIPGYMPVGETDGPVGAVIMAKGLTQLGHRVSVVMEPEILEVVKKVLKGISSTTIPKFELISSEDADAYAKRQADTDIAIAIEKLGANGKGVRHSVGGTPVTTGDAFASEFIEHLNRQGALTIGIGDNGNEIGFGKIAPLARSIVPWGGTCRCECNGGIVTTAATQILVPCAVSNYGAYVMMTALACYLEKPDLLIEPELISELVTKFVAEGMVNGAIEDDTDFIGDDGIPLSGVKAFAELFRLIGQQYFTRVGDHR